MSRDGAAGSRPGHTRPRSAPSRPARARVERAAKPGRGTTFTARAAVLLVALVVVGVAVTVPLKQFLAQRRQIASLTSQTTTTRHQVAALQAQHHQWQQAGYVEEQARNRLHYVLPGQKTYLVIGKAGGTGRSVPGLPTATTGPWYSQLWGSVQAAGASSR